ncbi:hypothetical protein HMPREF1869_01247 [Bacteroidales bacterium KA00251]|nr:hypothetical protein HMPREF1869_01247 [Bacteroidales bacterium KA00251]
MIYPLNLFIRSSVYIGFTRLIRFTISKVNSFLELIGLCPSPSFIWGILFI